MDIKELQGIIDEKGAEYQKKNHVKKAEVPPTAQELYWALMDVRCFLGKMGRSHRFKAAADIAMGVVKEIMDKEAKDQSGLNMAS